MLFFKKKEKGSTDLGWLRTDMHSHLIPGIDDGSPDMETSLSLLRGFVELGYQKVITTPHVLADLYPNTTEGIRQGLAGLQAAVQAAGIPIEVEAAAEYFMDEPFAEAVKARKPLLTLKDNLLLVEISMVTAPLDLQDMLFELQLGGYQPVIAHPERYIYAKGRRGFFETLRDAGCLFQLNLLSLTGHYGTAVRDLAEELVKEDYYDFAGTDLHGARHLEGLQKLGSSPTLKRWKESGRLRNGEL
jgi:protein-tyrosine phosphatase